MSAIGSVANNGTVFRTAPICSGRVQVIPAIIGSAAHIHAVGTRSEPIRGAAAQHRIKLEDFYEGFEFVSHLGEGASGSVDLVRLKDGRLVALKIFKDDEATHEMDDGAGEVEGLKLKGLKGVAQTEAVIVCPEDDPEEPIVVDSYEELQQLGEYQVQGVVQSYLPGVDLADAIDSHDCFDTTRASSYALQILKAVKALHDREEMHRDIKAGNVRLNEQDKSGGPFGTTTIMDLGLASDLHNDQDPRIRTFCGTPEYMAPELVEEKPADKKIDNYSIGILMQFMVLGTVPFSDENLPNLVGLIAKYGQSKMSLAEYPDTSANMAALSLLGKTYADVADGLAHSDPNKRMTLETAIQKLEAV